MADRTGDRIAELSTTTGTGSLALAGSVTGFKRFGDVLANGDRVFYLAVNAAVPSEWEEGIGTWASGHTLARTRVLASSNGGAAVNFSAGAKQVSNVMMASMLDAARATNLIINGDGAINQRVAGAGVADDTYAWDRHYVLTQTGTITVSSLSAVANGVPSMMRLSQAQASAQRMGVATILEAADTIPLRGKRVTLGGWLRYSNAAAVRYAILEWTGTADSPTSDVVNSWTNGTFTAGQFFISSNLTVRQVGSLTPSAAALTEFRLEADVGSSANNLILMIWTEGTAAQNSTLDVAWFLAEGSIGYGMEPARRPRGEELDLCLRYYQAGVGTLGDACGWFGAATSAGIYYAQLKFSVEMRVAPTVVPTHAGQLGGSFGTDNGTSYQPTVKGFSVYKTASGTVAAGGFFVSWTATAEL